MMMRRMPIYALLMLMISACDSLPDWMGNDSERDKPLKGSRVSVLDYASKFQADPQLDAPVRMMEPKKNAEFAFEAAPQLAEIDNVQLSGTDTQQSAVIGDGNGWDSQLIPQPVIGNGQIFAMDAAGYISAHRADDIDARIWESDALVMEDEPDVGGGGLAYANGVVYATTGYGSIAAFVAADGSLLWRAEIAVPVRAAPCAAEGLVLAVTIDNQLLAFDARTGKSLWSHRGIKESAVYLGTVTPMIKNGIVVVAYTSGELFALRAEDGSPLWSDTLLTTKRTNAAAPLTGIDATPVIRDNIVYALSNSGLMVANSLSTGSGQWDMEISGYHTPWVAGDYVFVLTANHELVALARRNKSVKWVASLRQIEEGGKDETPHMTSPMMVNNQLLLITEEGDALWFDPENGKAKGGFDAPDNVRVDPVIANGSLYLVDASATLYRLGQP